MPAPVQQPRPAARRRPSRAWARFVPVTTVNATPSAPVTGTVQPASALPAPRRRPGRAWLRFIPVATVNAAPAGSVQPEATVPVPRRRLSRAVARGTAVACIRGKAPTQEYRTPPRRRRARAWVHFIPVTTANATVHRTLVVSIASQAGTDDYGNSYPQGMFVESGIVKVGSDASQAQVLLVPAARPAGGQPPHPLAMGVLSSSSGPAGQPACLLIQCSR